MTVTRPAAPVLPRVIANLPELSRLIVRQISDELPGMRALPDDVLQVDIRTAVERNLALVLQAVAAGSEVETGHLAQPLRNVMASVEDRPSFADVLGAYFIGIRMGWEKIVETAAPDELPELVRMIDPLIRQLSLMLRAVSHAYLDEHQQWHSEAGEARRELAAALLAGEPVAALAERAGLAVATGHWVLAWREAAHPASEPVMVRRRRVRAVLNDRCHGTVLTVLEDHGGIALIPLLGEEHRDAPGNLLGLLRELVADIGTISGVPVVGAAALAQLPDRVPAAAREAHEVLDVAARLRRPPGLYQLDDLLLEVQLARPGTANDRLAERLVPLLRRPDLFTTLRTFISARHNRTQAARSLHVHPNTLDYRLRRIADLTRLDPTDPAQMRTLTAALTVLDLRS